MSAHTGTHIDAPSHFVAGAGDIDQVALERLIGPCWVVSCEGAATIDGQMLENAFIPADFERLLLKTDNHRLWCDDFDPSYVALEPSAASWLVDRGIKLVGIDYLSIQSFEASDRVHIELLEAEMVILEGLDLSQVEPGAHELMCLPLKLEGIEAAPARAVVRPLQ
jgi:arylformamidase